MSASKRKISITLLLIICAVFALTAVSSAGMATTSAPARQMAPANAPSVNPDRTVTFTLKAPQANEVILSFQNMTGKAPTGDPYPMTKDAAGVWSITMGPLDPNWYGYAFIIDGVQVADPANRDFSLFQAPPLWSGWESSAWSWVFVPGPAADFMADALVPHGAVATVRYHSDVLQSEQQMMVYTPPGYNKSNRKYPVLYLYPGGGGMNTDWPVNMRANFILDNLIAQDKIVPMIVVMPEYQVRKCSSFEDVFPQELLDSVIPATEENFRVAPGGKNRALAALSSGGGCVMNTLFWEPGAFAYVGAFSPNWTAAARNGLVQNHPDLLTNPAINKGTELLWIANGALENVPAYLALLDQYGIEYTFVPGSEIGALYGHVWDTWRYNLLAFAQVLFK